MKVAIIWPVYPWRWGIAHHTNNLVKYLVDAGQEVNVYTFSKQYPAFLYPGKFQLEPEGTNNPLKTKVHQIFNPINPFTWLRTILSISQFHPSLIIIKYWHPFFSPSYTFILWFLKKRNIQILCIVENLFPHEWHFGTTLFTKLFFSQVDRAVTQSEIVHESFKIFFPNLPEMLIPHPVYDQFWEPVKQSTACDYLQIPKNKTILLFFGFIRPYKWLDIFLNALPGILEKCPSAYLVIAGECFGNFHPYQNIIDKHSLGPYIRTNISYIPNEEIRYWFWACDLLVMPYRSMTNSGIQNIWIIYAKASLLTLWLNERELAQKVLESLSVPQSSKQQGMTWSNYVSQLIIFCSNHRLPN